MTRKHFEAIAQALRTTSPYPGDSSYIDGKVDQWRADVRHLADVCAAANPAFDRARFYRAAGYTD